MPCYVAVCVSPPQAYCTACVCVFERADVSFSDFVAQEGKRTPPFFCCCSREDTRDREKHTAVFILQDSNISLHIRARSVCQAFSPSPLPLSWVIATGELVIFLSPPHDSVPFLLLLLSVPVRGAAPICAHIRSLPPLRRSLPWWCVSASVSSPF